MGVNGTLFFEAQKRTSIHHKRKEKKNICIYNFYNEYNEWLYELLRHNLLNTFFYVEKPEWRGRISVFNINNKKKCLKSAY